MPCVVEALNDLLNKTETPKQIYDESTRLSFIRKISRLNEIIQNSSVPKVFLFTYRDKANWYKIDGISVLQPIDHDIEKLVELLEIYCKNYVVFVSDGVDAPLYIEKSNNNRVIYGKNIDPNKISNTIKQ